MHNNYEDMKILYTKNHCRVENMTENERKEFESYNIPEELMKKWKQEWVDSFYKEVMDFIYSKPDVKYLDSRLSNRMHIYVDRTIQNEASYRKIVDMFKKLHELNILVPEIRAVNRPRVFLKRQLLCDKDKLLPHEFRNIHYHSNHRFCGLIERVYSEGYIDLFNDMMEMMCDCIKESGIFFQYFIVYLMDYMVYIGNEYYLNKIKECVDINKKSGISHFEHKWEI